MGNGVQSRASKSTCHSKKLVLLTAGSELEVKVVNTSDMQRVMYLRDQLRPVKNVSFDHSGALLAVSCTDGVIYVYSLSSEEPQLVKRVDGLISLLDSESEASAKIAWHPDGRAFGAPNALNGMSTLIPRTRQSADNNRLPNRCTE